MQVTEGRIFSQDQIRDLLYTDTDEPIDYQGMRDRFVNPRSTLNVEHLIGDLNERSSRIKALQIFKSSQERIIGTFIHGKVGGLIFDAFHNPTVNAIMDIKSLGGHERVGLFSIVTTLTAVRYMIDESALGSAADLSNLAGQCFIQLPLNVDAKRALSKNFWSLDKQGNAITQFFIPEPNSSLNKLVADALVTKPYTLLAGTSANFTGVGSLVNPVQAASFCIGNSIYWLDDKSVPASQRGSFTTIKILDGIVTEERTGNMPFEKLREKIKIPQSNTPVVA